MLTQPSQAKRSIEDQCISLAALQPETRPWFVKVFVSEKLPVRTTRWGKQQLLLVLTDEQNRSIHCVINQADIPDLDNVLKPYEAFIVGNGSIKRNTWSIPSLTDSALHIVLTRSSYIRAAKNDDTSFVVDRMYVLTPFSRCPELTDVSNARISYDLLCGVIHVFPTRTVKKNNRDKHLQEFVVVDQECRPMILSLWEDFLQNEAPFLAENINNMPVILAMRVAVSTFHGISIATMPNNSILFNVPLPQAQTLQLWLQSNRAYIEDVVNEKLYEIAVQPLPAQVRKISQIQALTHKIKSFWVKAKLRIVDTHQLLYISCCPGCLRQCGSTPGNDVVCFYCKGAFPGPTPLFQFQAELFDSTGALTIRVEDKEGRDLLQLSAEDIVSLHQQERKFDVAIVNDKFKELPMFYHVRPAVPDMQGKAPALYTLVSFVPSSESTTSSSEAQCSSSIKHKEIATDVSMQDAEATKTRDSCVLEGAVVPLPALASKRATESALEPGFKVSKHAKQD